MAKEARVALDSCERPWGAWYVLSEGDGFKVKRIVVNPGQRLSLQAHAKRSEHWVVVRGTATCTIDGETVIGNIGNSIDVPVGAAHRLANDGAEVLEIIEVQHGGYLEEDDICRLEDDYGREDDEIALS